jgi:hypothetical protein
MMHIQRSAMGEKHYGHVKEISDVNSLVKTLSDRQAISANRKR